MSSTGFTIHHLPFGVITVNDNEEPSLATAYGDFAINVSTLAKQDFFTDIFNATSIQLALLKPNWNAFAALDSVTRSNYRSHLKKWLQSTTPSTLPIQDQYQSAWIPLSSVKLHFPMQTSNYTDFYCSEEHAKNCSSVFNLPISPVWYTLPQVYNGRTSSLAVSGTPITRPVGIFPLKSSSDSASSPPPPTFQAETKLDFELEMGVFISQPLPRGQRLTPHHLAKSHIFGIALLNDWSARSIQFYEIQPLGPFHSKGSLTSVAGWITPIEALDEIALSPRHKTQSPPPLPHLAQFNHDEDNPDNDRATWSVHVTASLIRNGKEYLLSTSNLNELHWTPIQQLIHLASAGEGLSTGDIFGTGTLSSARTNDAGEKTGLSCLWERQVSGGKLSSLPEGIETRLLEDGDEVVLRGWCGSADGSGEVAFRLGDCRGRVLPAVEVGVTEKRAG